MISFNKLRNRLNIQESVVLYSNVEKDVEKDSAKNIDLKNPIINNFYNSVDKNTTQTFKLNDGTTIHITPVEAKNVVYAYEELNDAHQGIFENFLENNIESYSLMIQFCEQYNN